MKSPLCAGFFITVMFQKVIDVQIFNCILINNWMMPNFRPSKFMLP
jgi:hypothetical protein